MIMNTQGLPPPPDLPQIPVVLLPYVNGMARADTLTRADQAALQVYLCPIDPQDPHDYGRLLDRAWGQYEQLLILEHDVVPPPGRLEEMALCPRQVCSTAYPIMGTLHEYGLGCVRYSRTVQESHPLLMWHATQNYRGQRIPTPWMHLDGAIARELSVRGVPVHTHAPPAVHLHDYGDGGNG
jgi:hypothetical protein